MKGMAAARWASVLGCVWLAAPLHAEDWPYWRGPRRDGTSAERGVPIRWSRTQNVVWRLPMPGSGGATPVIWGNRIFVTSVDGNGVALLCASTEGKILWKRALGNQNQVVRSDEGDSASPSPSTDGKFVWAMTSQGSLACFDVQGNPIWTADLDRRYGPLDIAFGFTSTPVLDGERLYLQVMVTGRNAVVAIDARTGQGIWRHDRRTDARAECEHSYASPQLYRDGEREFVVAHGSDYVTAHRLNDGSEIWRCGELNPHQTYNPTLRFVASPVAVPGLIVVPTAKQGRIVGLRPDGQGDITHDTRVCQWVRPRDTPDVPCPLVHDGLVYLCRENGYLLCLDVQSGEEVYHEPTHRMRHRASPVLADGHVYLTARDGRVTVVKAGRQFQIVASNELEEPLSASPVIAAGRLYLRSFDALYAIEEKDEG